MHNTYILNFVAMVLFMVVLYECGTWYVVMMEEQAAEENIWTREG
jgi:hypothetical protein